VRTRDALPAEFKQEPRMALDGGGDGLDIIRKLLRQARTRLQPHGIVMIEVGGLMAAMNREFAALDLHWLHSGRRQRLRMRGARSAVEGVAGVGLRLAFQITKRVLIRQWNYAALPSRGGVNQFSGSLALPGYLISTP